MVKHEADTSDPVAERKPRRRLTPEERIAERKAEIAAIEAAQRARALAAVDEVKMRLIAAIDLAEKAGMKPEAEAWRGTLLTLGAPK